MFKNYYILNRIVCELNKILPGVKIQEAYTQERDRIYFRIADENNPDRHLIISTDHNLPHIVIKTDHKRAKKNVPSFFSEYLPNEICEVQIAENDRIIRIALTNGDIYFFIRGYRTNVVFIDMSGKLHYFKKITKEEELALLDELKNKAYTAYFIIPDLSEFENEPLSYEKIKKYLPGLGKEIARELKDISPEKMLDALMDFLGNLATNKIVVFFSELLQEQLLLPRNSRLITPDDELKEFDTALEAASYYISTYYRNENVKSLEKNLSKYLDKELAIISSRLNKLSKRVEDGSKEVLYNHLGSLLLGNLHTIKKGMKEIELFDYVNNTSVKIEINEKLSPNKNIDYYFQKSKDEKISYLKSVELFTLTENKYKELLKNKAELETSESAEELKDLSNELKIKPIRNEKKKVEETIKYRHYRISDKYDVYIGRDNKNNDLLTFKFAKQNDFWFHARAVPGSHVVLRIDNSSEPIPGNILKNVASLAAYYSKAKTAGTVPVAYTFRKYVRKKKGMEPGKVIMEKEKVLLVKPEIPANSIQIEE